MKKRLPALLCAMILLVCVLASYPMAEIGMVDDWSYVQTTRILAQTGHIVYNGWATAMLGWQLYLGALFVKLFGPSFTSIRASTLLVSLMTAYLTQRTMMRTGVSARNATIGTLVVVLSPLALPLEFGFMTDMGGLFFLMLCLYACLRALQTESDRARIGWLIFAAASNAVGGTARQIAWLGVLVIVPSAIWLLRKRRNVVVTGVIAYIASAAFIFAAIQWFQHQPYSLPEALLPAHFNGRDVAHIFERLCVVALECTLFLMPVLAAFVPAISLRDRRNTDFLILGGTLCVVAALFLAHFHPLALSASIAPYQGNYVTPNGLVDGSPIQGTRPVVLPLGARLLLTIAVLFVLACFVAFLRNYRSDTKPQESSAHISWNGLLILLVPFIVAYVGLLIPRGLENALFDRYLLPIMPLALILILRLYQDRVKLELPRLSMLLTVLFAAYAIAGTHDAFSLYRAKAEAITELQASGVDDAAIDGGFEHNAMAQIERYGYVNDFRLRAPAVVVLDPPSPFPQDCQPDMQSRTPVLVPGYALSFDPNACGQASRFAPVRYRNWLWGGEVNLYIVATTKAAPTNR